MPSISISELKKNPSAAIFEAQNEAVTVLNHNKPAAYLLSVAEYETLTGRVRLGSRIRQRFQEIADDGFLLPDRADLPRGY
ncbi:type II toxin-antitoxin system Phd/YefM family antitoxin [Neisseria leonii]|uniref:type II toxin-antitoxin system Phd/YefM family antitoxin n=1 Tax=Neisseria leonii TaxID=2995413 RepID=UPI00237AC30E|nr:type II toxin-antitoxin system prevent-host-death family antitoxin [Neisseria sp. 3986]MDD9325179.1 type II toxin-antitoxin system Phd/YefM family antitoxin [Neisseria sp. 3986]